MVEAYNLKNLLYFKEQNDCLRIQHWVGAVKGLENAEPSSLLWILSKKVLHSNLEL